MRSASSQIESETQRERLEFERSRFPDFQMETASTRWRESNNSAATT